MDKEHARIIVAIALSFAVFFLWEFFFVDRNANLPKETVSEEPQNLTQNQESLAPAPQDMAQTLAASTQPEIPAATLVPFRQIRINTDLYQVTISEKGAVFTSFVLNDYRDSVDEGAPLFDMISKEIENGTLRVGFSGNSVPGIETAIFKADIPYEEVNVTDASHEIVFSWHSPGGVQIEKVFSFQPDTYSIGLKVNIINGGQQSLRDKLVLTLVKPSPKEKARYGFEGPSALIDGKLEQIDLDDIEEKSNYPGNIKWIAVQDRYFLSGILPEKTQNATMMLALDQDNLLSSKLVHAETTISPGTMQTITHKLFFGPKSMRILKTIGNDLDDAINFGMFDVIAKPCVMIMNFLYGFIPNYGIAIIILTILTKILLWPLGTKSYKSMNEMKKIQPLMTDIREKYKHDKKKMNEETMALYKIYKVNPMGGCLPMIVQIPVFFALYRMLYEAIELRHAPFFGWINDLSAPDRLFSFGFSIPFMEPPYGIPVLTVVMGATMFLQQKMSPPAGDPTQAKMMMMMPIVFTFIFINFSSGLVLYWLINNILSISQQYYISKKFA
jgi:YidC/Oxa1 family membrane protein insertase